MSLIKLRKIFVSNIFYFGLEKFDNVQKRDFRAKMVNEWQSQKTLVEKRFWSESIQNISNVL